MKPASRLVLLLLGLAPIGGCGSHAFPSSQAIFAEALARFDGDKDGTLSTEEYAKFDPLPDTFGQMDTSHDGKVDVDEFAYYIHANQPRALVSRKNPGGNP